MTIKPTTIRLRPEDRHLIDAWGGLTEVSPVVTIRLTDMDQANCETIKRQGLKGAELDTSAAVRVALHGYLAKPREHRNLTELIRAALDWYVRWLEVGDEVDHPFMAVRP